MRERPISSVPATTLVVLALAFALQLGWQLSRPSRTATAENLPPPPSISALRLCSFGEPIALAKVLMLYVQAFDSQPGIMLPFRKLDYGKVVAWLTDILALDPPGQYPLFAASRLYGEVADQARQRIMFEFVYREFLLDPNRRWRAMAAVAVSAKHGLKDLPLARKYAQAIRLHATDNQVPQWARQMEIMVLEDMNELETAKVLIGGMLASGQVTDQHELRFLEQRLNELELKARQASKK